MRLVARLAGDYEGMGTGEVVLRHTAPPWREPRSLDAALAGHSLDRDDFEAVLVHEREMPGKPLAISEERALTDDDSPYRLGVLKVSIPFVCYSNAGEI